MNVSDAAAIPTSPLHALLLGEQAELKIACQGMFSLYLPHIVVPNCTEPAKWQIAGIAGAHYCDTHKQQMPPFMVFNPLETNRAAVVHCSVNPNHGLASKYCSKCMQSLCIHCAYDHVAHGAKNIADAQKEIASQIEAKLTQLEEQAKEEQPIVEKLRNITKTMQMVRTLSGFIISKGQFQFENTS